MTFEAVKRFFGIGEGKPERKYDCVVLLWGPDYDRLTSHTSQWIGQLAGELKLNEHAFIGDSISRDRIARSLQLTQGMTRVKIFFGHGVERALLGPPQGSGEFAGGRWAGQSILYDQTSIVPLDQGASSLFAFCCRAGISLGQDFATSGRRAFLGYQADIPLEVGNLGCANAWGRVTRQISLEIIEAGGVYPEHKLRLEALYQQELKNFSDGPERENDRRLIMMMYLRRHQKELCCYGDLKIH